MIYNLNNIMNKSGTGNCCKSVEDERAAYINHLKSLGYRVVKISTGEHFYDIDIRPEQIFEANRAYVEQPRSDNDIARIRENGRNYGYPDCCIEHFARSGRGEKIGSSTNTIFSGSGYVPCPKCVKKDPLVLINEINNNRILGVGKFLQLSPNVTKYCQRTIDREIRSLKSKLISDHNRMTPALASHISPSIELIAFQTVIMDMVETLDVMIDRFNTQTGKIIHDVLEDEYSPVRVISFIADASAIDTIEELLQSNFKAYGIDVANTRMVDILTPDGMFMEITFPEGTMINKRHMVNLIKTISGIVPESVEVHTIKYNQYIRTNYPTHHRYSIALKTD